MSVRCGQGVETITREAQFGQRKLPHFSYDGVGYTRPAPAPTFSDGRRPFWQACKREAVAHLQLAAIGCVTGAAVVIFATIAGLF